MPEAIAIHINRPELFDEFLVSGLSEGNDISFTIKELLDNGLDHIREVIEISKCPYQKIAAAVIKAAVTELMKHVNLEQVVKGKLNENLRLGLGGMGEQIHDFTAKVSNSYHSTTGH